MLVDLWQKGFDKILKGVPKGMEIPAIMAEAQGGMAPAMFADPKLATAMYELTRETDPKKREKANEAVTNYMMGQEKMRTDQLAGWDTLANLKSPLDNLATLLESILETIAGPLTGGVQSINNVVTSVGRHLPGFRQDPSFYTGKQRMEMEMTAKFKEAENVRKMDEARQARAMKSGL